MQPVEHTIDVGLHEQTEDLLARVEALPVGSRVRLNVPRDAITMRTLEDYNVLRDLQKRRQLGLTVVSPEPTIIGLARIYGFEVENLAAPKAAPVPAEAGDEEALPRFPRRAAPPAEPAGPPLPEWPAYGPAAAEKHSARPAATARPQGAAAAPPEPANGKAPVADVAAAPLAEVPPAPPAPAVPETPAPASDEPPAENDWLFGADQPADDLDLDLAAPLQVDRSATPPPGVYIPATAAGAASVAALAGPAAAPPAPPEYAAASPSGRTFVDTTQQVHGEATVLGSGGPAGSGRTAPVPAGAPVAAAAAGAAAGALAGAAFSAEAGAPPAPAIAEETAPPEPFAATAAAGGPTAPTPDLNAPPVAVPPPVIRPRPAVVTRPARRRSRGGAVALVLLGLLLVFLGLGTILALNIAPTLATASVTIVPRTTGALTPVSVVVPVLVGGSADTARVGLAAPQVLTNTAPLSGTTPLTGTLPLSGTVPMTGTLPVTGTAPLTGTVETPGPRTAQPVTAEKIIATLHATAAISTTGVETVPHNSAVGTVEFTNESANAVTVPKGTELIATNGKKFHTVNGITVPGTDFLAHTFGVVRVDIQADEAGPASNGARVGGSYGNTVFVTVRVPGGGDTMQVPVVADADRDKLLGKLKGQIDAQASQALQDQVNAAGADMTPITCTLVLPSDISATQYQANPAPGTRAAAIQGVMTATVSVYAFHLDVARHQAAMAALAAAPTDLPVDAQVDPSSIDESGLTFSRVNGCDGPRVLYQTQIQASLVYSFPTDSTVQAQIRQLVAGKSPSQAQAAIQSSPLGPYIEQVNIGLQANSPLSAPETIPETQSNIQVRVASARALGGTGGTRPTAGPDATPVLGPDGRPLPTVPAPLDTPTAAPRPTIEPK